MGENINKPISLMHKVITWMLFVVFIVMIIVVALAIVELGILLYSEIFNSIDDVLFLEIDELFRIFGFCFIILIGFELIETVEMHFKNNVIHAEVVLLVAIIALARKVILLDLEEYDPLVIIGLGLIIFALGGCYALIKLRYRIKKV